MWIALGKECRIYDYGARRKLSKTVYHGIPVIKYCLMRFWLNKTKEEIKVVHIDKDPNGNDIDKVEQIYQNLFNYNVDRNGHNLDKLVHLTNKYKYYRQYFLNTNEIKLVGISECTTNDAKWNFYNNILKNI